MYSSCPRVWKNNFISRKAKTVVISHLFHFDGFHRIIKLEKAGKLLLEQKYRIEQAIKQKWKKEQAILYKA